MKTQKILLIVGVAMVAYGGYYWVKNRSNDKSLTDTTPPKNPSSLKSDDGKVSNKIDVSSNETVEQNEVNVRQRATGSGNANSFYNN